MAGKRKTTVAPEIATTTSTVPTSPERSPRGHPIDRVQPQPLFEEEPKWRFKMQCVVTILLLVFAGLVFLKKSDSQIPMNIICLVAGYWLRGGRSVS